MITKLSIYTKRNLKLFLLTFNAGHFSFRRISAHVQIEGIKRKAVGSSIFKPMKYNLVIPKKFSKPDVAGKCPIVLLSISVIIYSALRGLYLKVKHEH